MSYWTTKKNSELLEGEYLATDILNILDEELCRFERLSEVAPLWASSIPNDIKETINLVLKIKNNIHTEMISRGLK